MICKKCGKEIPDASKFCPECGYDFSGNNDKPEKKKTSPLGIVALIVSFFGPAGFIGSIIGIADIISDKEKKKTHTLAIIAIVLGILVTIATSGSKGNATENTVSRSTSTTSELSDIECTSETSSAAVTENDASKFTSEKAKDIYKKGEQYTNKYTSITMIDCGIASDEQLSKYSEVPSGCEIVYASFEVNDIGDTSQSVMYTDFNGYADDNSCNQFYSLEGLGKTGLDFADTLSAGRKISGTVGFVVPKDTKNFEIEYKPDFWLDDVITFNVPLN